MVSAKLEKLHVFILSDATGITAERVISAVLVQFKSILPVFERFPFTKSREEIRTALEKAKETNGIVIYSLASEDLRDAMRREKRKTRVPTIDILGPLLNKIGGMMNQVPILRPGLLDQIGDESIRLAQSIDFTLKHDDGQNAETLDQADLIIIGVSRTSKTPTSLYLSCNHNLKVANVPIIKDLEPPEQIFSVNVQRVGFTISPERLAFIRKRRYKKSAVPEYADKKYIIEELRYCRQIFSRIPGLHTIDVTNISIEEIANRIM